MKIKAVGINARFTHSCLALFYIRNEIEKHIQGAEVQICQYTINDPYYTTVQRLGDGGSDYIFFSSVIWNSDLIENLIDDLLVINDTYHFVIGGPQADIVGARFKATDRVSVFAGNIEVAGREFYHDLVTHRLKKHYVAPFFKSRHKQLGYPYRPDDFSGPLKNRHIYYETSRGCPFSCTYCLSSTERGLYHKPLDQVFHELDNILRYRPTVVRFLDRTFNDDTQRALSIWKYLAQYGGKTLFHFEIAPDRFNEEIFGFLETMEPGCFQFEIGIQSTNAKTLDVIRRPVDPCSAASVVRRLRGMENIHLHADLILGLPFETHDTFRRSFNDVFTMEPHYVQMGLLKVLPGTIIADTAEENGYRVSGKTPYSVFANRWLDGGSLKELYWMCECVEKCVNNRFFVSFWHHMATREEDISAFFLKMSQSFLQSGYLWLAATQETLSGLLLNQVSHYPDYMVLRELLCYDWLRCGHRFLPEHLQYSKQSIEDLRRGLFHRLPAVMAPLYDKKTRNHFLKKGIFHSFSRETLSIIGYEVASDNGIICFCPERERSVNRLQSTLLIGDAS